MYMLVETPEAIAREWEKYAGFTVRPQPSTIDYYHEVIDGKQSGTRHAILGATPEIRSVYQSREQAVTLLEQSLEMVQAMGSLTIANEPLSSYERWQRVDWRTMSSHCVDQYHLIIGDDAINMLAWQEFDGFLAQVNRLLVPGGEFLCRLLLQPDLIYRRQSFTQVMREYFDGVIKSKYDLASRLNFICYDEVSMQMGWRTTIEKIGRENLNQFKPAFDFTATFKACNSRFTCPPQVQFERLINHHFDIVEVFYSSEHEFCDFEPVYRLIKRGA